MLEWLNNNIGSDWATYAGLLLAVVSLFWGGSKLLFRKKITQTAKVKGGTVVQVGGNMQTGNNNESKSGS